MVHLKKKVLRRLGEKVLVGGKPVRISDYTPPVILKQTKRRGDVRVIYDVLRAAQSFNRPTKIMEQKVASLSYKKLQRMLKELSGKKLLTVEKTGVRESSVNPTQKGLEAIRWGTEFLTLIGEL